MNLICNMCLEITLLPHWGQITHIFVSNLTIIGSDNGLSPGRRQAIIWTNGKILLIGPFGTNFSEILIATDTFSDKKMHLKMSSARWRPFWLGLNALKLVPHLPGASDVSLLVFGSITLFSSCVTIEKKNVLEHHVAICHSSETSPHQHWE